MIKDLDEVVRVVRLLGWRGISTSLTHQGQCHLNLRLVKCVKISLSFQHFCYVLYELHCTTVPPPLPVVLHLLTLEKKCSH